MNSTLKSILLYSAKNAINALLVNTGAWLILPANFNLHNTAAIWNIAKLAVWTVAVREGSIWIPKLIKWSTTNGSDLNLQ